MPKVSIVMPVFNGECHIGEAVNSVLAQRQTDLELIVVNDGSTDKTLEVVQRFAEADPRVRVINRPNSGRPSFPKNDGIASARGEYLCFLDHDDIYDADRTWQLVEGLEQHPEWVAVFHDLRLIDNKGNPFPETYLSGPNFLGRAAPYITPMANDWFDCSNSFYVYQSLHMGALHTMSVMIALRRLPPGTVSFETKFTIGEDTDQWIRLGLMGKIGYLNRVLGSYRQHENSITQNREIFLMSTLRMWEHNFQRVKGKLSPSELRQYRVKISDRFADLAYRYYLENRSGEARAAYREALAWSAGHGAVLGYMKTFIPAGLVRALKGLVSRK